MNKKKFYALISALLALVIALSGCASSGDKGQTSSQETSSQIDLSGDNSTQSDTKTENSVEDNSQPQQESSTEDSSDDQSGDQSDDQSGDQSDDQEQENLGALDINNLPTFQGDPFVAVNDYIPNFTPEELEKAKNSYETYAKLDSLGRCGTTIASVGIDIMPTEPRESISSVKPSGWNNVKYDTSLVDGGYIYNRCHLLGFQLTGENANKYNLITGTRYMNVDGMLPFENMVADYVKETKNHVLLRVTPIFVGNELVARGVQMEAYSIEDEGDGICYNVYCFNVQPGITINYLDGSSALSGTNAEPNPNPDEDDSTSDESKTEDNSKEETPAKTYALNTNTKKFHDPDCSSAKKISDKNYAETTESRDSLIAKGYSPCGICKP